MYLEHVRNTRLEQMEWQQRCWYWQSIAETVSLLTQILPKITTARRCPLPATKVTYFIFESIYPRRNTSQHSMITQSRSRRGSSVPDLVSRWSHCSSLGYCMPSGQSEPRVSVPLALRRPLMEFHLVGYPSPFGYDGVSSTEYHRSSRLYKSFSAPSRTPHHLSSGTCHKSALASGVCADTLVNAKRRLPVRGRTTWQIPLLTPISVERAARLIFQSSPDEIAGYLPNKGPYFRIHGPQCVFHFLLSDDLIRVLPHQSRSGSPTCTDVLMTTSPSTILHIAFYKSGRDDGLS